MFKKIAKFAVVMFLVFGAISFTSIEASADYGDLPYEELVVD